MAAIPIRRTAVFTAIWSVVSPIFASSLPAKSHVIRHAHHSPHLPRGFFVGGERVEPRGQRLDPNQRALRPPPFFAYLRFGGKLREIITELNEYLYEDGGNIA